MKLIYIAGPLGAEADWDANVREACRLAEVVSELGFAVVVPHCFVEWHRRFPADYETWIQRDLRLVECSDLVLRLPGISPGADRECKHAGFFKVLGDGWDKRDVEVVLYYAFGDDT